MKISDLQNILTVQDFDKVRNVLNKYQSELNEYKIAIAKKGSSIHLKIDKDADFEFTKEHLKKICLAYINDRITDVEVNFIVDTIIASISKFEDEYLLEVIEGLTDPEVNGTLTKAEVLKIYNNLNSNN